MRITFSARLSTKFKLYRIKSQLLELPIDYYMIALTDSRTYNALQVRPNIKKITRSVIETAVTAATPAFDNEPSLEVGNVSVSIGFPILSVKIKPVKMHHTVASIIIRATRLILGELRS